MCANLVTNYTVCQQGFLQQVLINFLFGNQMLISLNDSNSVYDLLFVTNFMIFSWYSVSQLKWNYNKNEKLLVSL